MGILSICGGTVAVGERSVVTAGSKDTRVENAWSMRAVSGTCMPALMLSDTLKNQIYVA